MKKERGKLRALGFASWLINGCGQAVNLFQVLVVLGRRSKPKKRPVRARGG